VGGEDRVVRLDDSGGDLGSRVDGKLQLGLLAVVHGEPLHEEGGEAGSSAATKGVEDEEALEPGALLGQLPQPVENQVDELLANGVVAPGVVVGGVLLAGDQLLRVEELPVCAEPDLVHDGGLEVDEDGPGHVLPSAGLGEEGVERVITTSDGLVRGHRAIRLDSMLKTVELPAGVADLAPSLAHVDRDTLTHCV